MPFGRAEQAERTLTAEPLAPDTSVELDRRTPKGDWLNG